MEFVTIFCIFVGFFRALLNQNNPFFYSLILNYLAMKSIVSYLESTNLSALITAADVDKLAADARQYNFVGVCLPPYWVKKAARDLQGTSVRLVTVVGFPLGYQRSPVKIRETEIAIEDGAQEIDMVLNLSAWKNETPFWAKAEVAALAKICHASSAALKVILETAYLSDDDIVTASKMCKDAGADFVKTSTGFASAGAKEQHIRLMRQAVGEELGVKASGGIKTLEQAYAMIEAGADRIGTSSAVQIAKEEWERRLAKTR
jgi:deoxyribose-phosphate aldolase